MPTPRRAIHTGRAQWSARHLAHLLSGHDWEFLDPDCAGWGVLSELDDAALVATVEDMSACWRHNSHLVTPEHCGLNDLGTPPWFAAYADDPAKLIAQERKARAYMEFQRANGGYRPYAEFEAHYKSHPAATCATATGQP